MTVAADGFQIVFAIVLWIPVNVVDLDFVLRYVRVPIVTVYTSEVVAFENLETNLLPCRLSHASFVSLGPPGDFIAELERLQRESHDTAFNK